MRCVCGVCVCVRLQVDAEKAELLDKDQQLVGQQIDQVPQPPPPPR